MTHEHEHEHEHGTEHEIRTRAGVRISADSHDGFCVVSYEFIVSQENADFSAFLSLLGKEAEERGAVIGHIKAVSYRCDRQQRLSLTDPERVDTAEIPGGAGILNGVAILYGIASEEAKDMTARCYDRFFG